MNHRIVWITEVYFAQSLSKFVNLWIQPLFLSLKNCLPSKCLEGMCTLLMAYFRSWQPFDHLYISKMKSNTRGKPSFSLSFWFFTEICLQGFWFMSLILWVERVFTPESLFQAWGISRMLVFEILEGKIKDQKRERIERNWKSIL